MSMDNMLVHVYFVRLFEVGMLSQLPSLLGAVLLATDSIINRSMAGRNNSIIAVGLVQRVSHPLLKETVWHEGLQQPWHDGHW
jgi:hypothetical protein